MSSLLDEMIASLEASAPAVPDVPLTQDDLRRLGDLMSGCFVGDEGCTDPDCWYCHSPLRPDNLRRFAQNIATAAQLTRAWQLCVDDPGWFPGCNLETTPAGRLVRVTHPRHYEGAIFCLAHLKELRVPQMRVTQFAPDVVAFWGHRCLMCGVDPLPGRHCENDACRRPLHPQWPAVYCSNDCAMEDT